MASPRWTNPPVSWSSETRTLCSQTIGHTSSTLQNAHRVHRLPGGPAPFPPRARKRKPLTQTSGQTSSTLQNAHPVQPNKRGPPRTTPRDPKEFLRTPKDLPRTPQGTPQSVHPVKPNERGSPRTTQALTRTPPETATVCSQASGDAQGPPEGTPRKPPRILQGHPKGPHRHAHRV